jgi:3-oxoacyl-[acyl-carrier-protein] synthase-3
MLDISQEKTWPPYRFVVPHVYTQAKVRLVGLGRYIPEGIITNEFFAHIATRLGYPRTSADFERATGLEYRRVRSRTLDLCRLLVGEDAPGLTNAPDAQQEETPVEMAALAAEHALLSAGRDASELDMVIATSSSDNEVFPTIAGFVQARLGCQHVRTATLKGGCACITEALQMAADALTASTARLILIVASDAVLSHSVHILDWRSSLLFGEGASAFLLERGTTDADETYAINGCDAQQGSALRYQTLLHREASEASQTDLEILHLYQTGSSEELDRFLTGYHMGYANMSGNRVYEDAPLAMAECVDVLCRHAGLSPDELTHIIPHQANSRIMRRIATVLMLEYDWPETTADKIADHFRCYGNLSNASIGLALIETLQAGRLQTGQWLALPAVGGGFHYGCWLFRYQGIQHPEFIG